MIGVVVMEPGHAAKERKSKVNEGKSFLVQN